MVSTPPLHPSDPPCSCFLGVLSTPMVHSAHTMNSVLCTNTQHRPSPWIWLHSGLPHALHRRFDRSALRRRTLPPLTYRWILAHRSRYGNDQCIYQALADHAFASFCCRYRTRMPVFSFACCVIDVLLGKEVLHCYGSCCSWQWVG